MSLLLKKPTYENKAGTRLYTGDALNTMSRVMEQGFAMVFLDPPFNIGEDYDGDGGKSDRKDWGHYLHFIACTIAGAGKLLRKGGTLCIHVPDEVVAYAYMYAIQCGLQKVNWLVLHQEFGQYTDGSFIRSKVHCLVFRKRPVKGKTWNVEEVLEPSTRLLTGDKRTYTAKHKGYRPFLDCWTGENLGRVQGNNEERWGNHPNQLPEMYLARLIRAYTNVGDFIFDPCVGSGTTLVVAQALKRKAWGCELNAKLAASAWKRVGKGVVRNVAGPLAVPHKFQG